MTSLYSAAQKSPEFRFAKGIVDAVDQEMHGMEDAIRLCLIAYCCRRHVLLEGNPGVGKTALVRAFSGALYVVYNRIQFTPDLMPSDITGTLMPASGSGEWRFQPGNIFAHLVLADEINRATPKTQAAMLQAMEESKITVPGGAYLLPEFNEIDVRLTELVRMKSSGVSLDPSKQSELQELLTRFDERRTIQKKRPFMILATQNPIDHEGVFSLPEAQSDRFMFKVCIDLPPADSLLAIIEKETGKSDRQKPLVDGFPATPGVEGMAPEERARHESHLRIFEGLEDKLRTVKVGEDLRQHIVNLVEATNRAITNVDTLKKLEGRDLDELDKVRSRLRYGLGPCAINLMWATRAWALLFQPGMQPVADAADLVRVLKPVLNHRLHVNFEYDSLEGREELLRSLIEHSAPRGPYRNALVVALGRK